MNQPTVTTTHLHVRYGKCPKCSRRLTSLADEWLNCPSCGWREPVGKEGKDGEEQREEGGDK